MFKRMLFVLFAVLAFGIASVVTAQDATPTLDPMATMEMEGAMEENTLTLEDAPVWVRETADRAAEQYFANATFDSVQFDTEGTVPAYEFAGTSEDGTTFEIDVYANGHLEEVEEVIESGEVPAEVTALLESYVNGFQLGDVIERSTRPTPLGLIEVYYEFSGTGANGAELDVEIKEDGSTITIEIGA